MRRLFIAAYRRNNRRATTLGHLDRHAADRAGAAGDKHDLTVNRTVREQAPIGRHRRDAQSCTGFEIDTVGK